MRVLIVKLSSLGDVIHTLPALTDAACALPGIRFDWAVEEAFTQVPEFHSAVDRVIPIALRRWRKNVLQEFSVSQWRRTRQSMRERQYDAVIDAQGLLKSAFVARQVDAPLMGFDARSARERFAVFAYQHKISVPRYLHAIERSRQLFASALRYPLPVNAGDFGLQDRFGALPPCDGKRLFFFHGSSRAEKLWPVEHWVALAQRASASGYSVALPWGSEEERLRASEIARRCDGDQVSVLPRLDLSAMASQLATAAAFVAVDTGLGHLGAALAVPGVSLYGPTEVALIGTYGNRQKHLRGMPEGGRGSLQEITPANVWQSLQELVNETNEDRGDSLSGEMRA